MGRLELSKEGILAPDCAEAWEVARKTPNTAGLLMSTNGHYFKKQSSVNRKDTFFIVTASKINCSNWPQFHLFK